MSKLVDRRILVTGASSGIGEATARVCAAAGAQVACLARRAERVSALASAIGGVAVAADLRDEAAARSGVEQAAVELGGLDALVNNAGVLRRAAISDGAIADFRLMFDVNVIGLLTATQAALPHLRAAGHADVVNVSSLSGRRVPSGDGGVYSATKFAVHALSEALRREVRADGVRVTVLAPGFVRTPFGEDAGDDDPHFHERKRALGLDPEAVAAAIANALAQPPEVHMREIALASSAQDT